MDTNRLNSTLERLQLVKYQIVLVVGGRRHVDYLEAVIV
jgi:hypothetical protein